VVQIATLDGEAVREVEVGHHRRHRAAGKRHAIDVDQSEAELGDHEVRVRVVDGDRSDGTTVEELHRGAAAVGRNAPQPRAGVAGGDAGLAVIDAVAANDEIEREGETAGERLYRPAGF